ncbi:hypothetical protein G6M89_09065 [Natronolimnobius sp. AArcel1]|uniref:hypothetical protein n=1 Tax=Natronolimnobius sp. AArcel1 TaxID=1679093 RepID=UPI0013EA3734|nr:hypothetical protein [Natronolimnobius sp. AArcel1]NGM69155.1 hypothetical protein [Natronolimnobius sp. AArcel1]
MTVHQQDGYPDDPDKRAFEESEAVGTTRRFAKYTVYRERGYPTLPPHENPDRIAATLVAIAQLSDDEFDALFGDYYRQHAHHFQPELEAPIEPPADIAADEFLRYELEVYLGVDEDLEAAIQEVVAAGLDEAAGRTLKSLAEPVDVDFDPQAALGLEVEAVSDIRVAYQTGPGNEQVLESDSPREREPDTVIQLVPLPAGSLDVFRLLLCHHLGCQIRDCYLEMGVEPPEAFRVVGHGFHHSAQRYRLLEYFEDYFDFDADIPGYRTIALGQDSDHATL